MKFLIGDLVHFMFDGVMEMGTIIETHLWEHMDNSWTYTIEVKDGHFEEIPEHNISSVVDLDELVNF